MTEASVRLIVVCCVLGMLMTGGLSAIEKSGAAVIVAVVTGEVEVA